MLFFHTAIDFREHCEPRMEQECCLYARERKENGCVTHGDN